MEDAAAAYGLEGWPVVAVVLLLFAGALLRSHAIYWLGRAVTRGAEHARDAQRRSDATGPAWWHGAVGRADAWTRSAAVARGVRLVRRWGAPVVAVAYLTVGVQSAVFAAAGVVRLPYARFTVASVPGSAAWAVVWSTVGLGAWWAAVALAARSPWALVGALLLVAGVVVVLRRRRAARGRTGSPAGRPARSR
ncbi:DedA family protein [Cellulomonas endophytica]|uniref:DedA family protein n=1 Tax=Cellulomonas endophytica TaxID=2494735 RepID=UPI0010109082|nr:VTT domain-containing protein [Cellulomonas endophytica]